MKNIKEILEELKGKYEKPFDAEIVLKEINNKIKEFHLCEKNRNSFNKWLDDISRKLDIQLKTTNNTFFPSESFYIYHDIKECGNFKIFKMEHYIISFIEDYFTTQFTSYITEKKEGSHIHYYSSKRPKRDIKFDKCNNDILKELHERYPNKVHMDSKLTGYIIGEYPVTYSKELKTSIFELLFRQNIR